MAKAKLSKFRTVGAGVVLDKESYSGEFEWDPGDEVVLRLVDSGHLEHIGEALSHTNKLEHVDEVETPPLDLGFYVGKPRDGEGE